MEEQMRYQAEMLAQVLRLAQVKVQALVQAVPEQAPELEARAQLLQQEVQAVLRQAVALQQLAALPQEQEAPLLELGVPQEVLQPMEALVQRELEQVFQRALAVAEAQAEVLEPGARVLVQVPLLEAE
jgi:hypothetical protein